MQTNLSEKILQLSISERIQLAEDIWDSIAVNQRCVDLTDLQKTILQERLEDYAANPECCESWDKVRKRILLTL
ncbi:MAG: addiction module protein [Desulfuromonadales bacterium]|nr:addiction module protein [Desulfuromonadales bacterium]